MDKEHIKQRIFSLRSLIEMNEIQIQSSKMFIKDYTEELEELERLLEEEVDAEKTRKMA